MNSLKTLSAAAGIAVVGTFAQAATVAEITADGSYLILANGQSTGLDISGNFTAFLDTGFDTSETNDFLFELDLDADGLPPIDEDLLVEGITGDDVLFAAFGLLADVDLIFPGLIDDLVEEVLDTDGLQSELGSTGIFLGFEFDLTGFAPDGVTGLGTFSALISDGPLDGIAEILGGGEFSGSATISTVSAVPLPATLPLLAFGGAGLMALSRRRKS